MRHWSDQPDLDACSLLADLYPDQSPPKRKNIMVVTPQAIPGPAHISLPDYDVWLRSASCGLVSLPVDILILAPGVTQEQRDLAMQKIQATNGVAYELRQIA